MLTVNDLMTVIPNTITLDTPLRHVIALMKAQGYRQLPVMDDGRLAGIITDRDVRLAVNSPILLDAQRENDNLLDNVTAESCMTPNPITVTPDTPAFRAAEMLSIYKFGALPVVDDETLVGIVTVTDFLDYFVAKEAKSIIEGMK